ncbi:JmjC domain-containing protein [Meloidogyne graminicola]|uniref:JmjC domain-containing protein n=1 Tax=Meloidogyne graminicola TaxID=189291 RepID=A0A8S9ZH03_9BILA|nr:JmjC domain-containing protein [Meloidogyne graminicola]
MSKLYQDALPLDSLINVAKFHPILYKHFKDLPILNVSIEITKELDKLSNGMVTELSSNKALNTLRTNTYRLERLCDTWLNTGHYSDVPDRLRLLYAFLCAIMAKIDFLREDYQSTFVPSPLPTSQQINSEYLPSLESFYKNYFLASKPVVINGIVNGWPAFEKWSYDFELTANSLLNISESFDSKLDLVSPEEPSEEQQNSVIIVPSEYPKVINPIERNQNIEVTLNQNYLIPEFNYNESLLSITELLEQLDLERRHCLSMANQVRGKPYGGALCGHYMRRAGTLRQEHLRLTYQCDRLNAWNCPNDCFIDLHGMNWKRAIELIKYKIYLCKETLPNLRKLQVITGYGSTSGHPSVIRQKLLKYLINNGIDFSYLNSVCGHRLVPVEIGNKYTDEDWRQQLMLFNEYLIKYVFIKQKEENKTLIGYLAQHRLLDQIPELIDDLIIPEYCSFDGNSEEKEGEINNEKEKSEHTINVFIGPGGTVSPLHTDPRNNMFCQLRGSKFVRLISPNERENLYLYDDLMRQNSSQVDVECPDLNKFSNFSNVKCYDYVLEAGQCLFIPRGWFHHIRALEPSISVSIWFGS